MSVVTNGSHNFMCVLVTSIQVNFTNGIYVCLMEVIIIYVECSLDSSYR